MLKEIVALGIEDFGFGFFMVVMGLIFIVLLGGFLPYGRKTGMKMYREYLVLKKQGKKPSNDQYCAYVTHTNNQLGCLIVVLGIVFIIIHILKK